MTINEAARKFEVSASRIRKLVTSGRIPGARYVEQDDHGNAVPTPYWYIPNDLKALPVHAKPGTPPGSTRKKLIPGAPAAPKKKSAAARARG